MPNAVPEKPWMHILVDFITKLLLVQRYDSILVVYDNENNTLCANYRKNFGRRSSEIVPG